MRKFSEVLFAFLRLGCTGFGGPLALVAQMQRDLVEKRGWIPNEEFQQAFALIKALPGAVAFNTATYLGRRRAGFIGAILAGFGLIAPAFLAILIFAASYSTLHQSALLEKVLLGMQAGALALIVAAIRPLTGRFIKFPLFWVLVAIGSAIFATDWVPEPILILAGGIAIVAWRYLRGQRRRPLAVIGVSAIPHLFLVCFKAGAFVFGTGIAIAPLLERDFVERHGWVTHAEFMDALAVGQITPGPVMLTTTFLGHKVAGVPGALIATVAVFLAGFIHMTTWFPSAVRKLSTMKWIEDFLFGALAMVIGTILVTVFILASPWIHEPRVGILSIVLLAAALWTRIPSWLLIVVGGVAGLVL